MAEHEQSQQPERDDHEPSDERKAELEAAYQQNMAQDKPPYAGVRILTYEEVLWICEQRGWSSELPLPEDKTRPDLSWALLSGAQMERALLSYAQMEGADLSYAQMKGANLSHAQMKGANLSYAQMKGANLHRAHMEEAFLREAHMEGALLSGAQMQGSLLSGVQMQGANLLGAQMKEAVLNEAQMEGANLSYAQMQKVDFFCAHMQGADLSGAQMEEADLSGAQMQGTNLINAQMQGTNLRDAQMEGADLSGVQMQGASLINAHLPNTDLTYVVMNSQTVLDEVELSSDTKLGDIKWNGVYLTRVDWNQVARLGDEQTIAEATDRKARVAAYRDAARAYRGLRVELKNQGLVLHSSRFRLREQQLERRALRVERNILPWFGSLLLDVVAGYGERPARIFVSYLVVVLAFAAAYLGVTHFVETGLSHLSWDEALVLSLTSFHGRGFFPGFLSLGDWVSRLAAAEAVIGLFIELMLIATFSRRFLGD